MDGHSVTVTAGSSLLAAARKLGLDIPALCYHPACEPNTACMACIVRIRPSGRVVPACATPAVEGLEIESESDEIRGWRRTALELLLSDHPCTAAESGAAAETFSCDCAQADHCRLRKYALAYGCQVNRFAGPARTIARQYEHPQLEYDPRKCILCGICVQLSEQAAEPLGLAVLVRGFGSGVDVPLDGSLAEAVQTSALRLAGACPTGALIRRQSAAGCTAPKD